MCPPRAAGFLSQRGSAASLFPTPCGSESKGPFSFAKENGPFGTPRERLRLAVQSLNDLCASGMRLPARGVAALGVARRFASAPIIRCRSAHLVEVQPNFRLPEHSTMRRALAMPLFRTQSAAKQTSHAPHDSKARLQDVTNCRRFMAKPCTPHLIPQAAQLFKIETANVGGRGVLPSRSLGGSRGPFSHVREWPPWCCGAHAAYPSALCAESNRSPEGAQKRSSPLGHPP